MGGEGEREDTLHYTFVQTHRGEDGGALLRLWTLGHYCMVSVQVHQLSQMSHLVGMMLVGEAVCGGQGVRGKFHLCSFHSIFL